MHRTPEGAIKDKVKKLLKKYGVWWFMYVPHGYQSGIPDFLCCVRGMFLAIECKAKDGMQPTALQSLKLEEIKQAGGLTFVATPGNLDELERMIRDEASK